MRAHLAAAIAIGVVTAGALALAVACGGGAPGAAPIEPPGDATVTDAGTFDGAALDADAGFTCPAETVDAAVPARPLRILFLTKETLFFHAAAHDAGDVAVPAYLRARGHAVTVSGDSSYFAGSALMPFDVVMFFVTSGNVVSEPDQQAALVSFVRAGRGVVGVHTATATDNDWQFMHDMMGATFAGHGSGDAQITPGRIDVADRASPLTSFLPSPWTRTDEWYFYDRNPALNPALKPLLLLDESSLEAYRPLYPDAGFYGDAGHPLAWTQDYQCSRIFYTALGHTGEAYSEEPLLRLLATGTEWAGAAASARP